MAKPEPLWWSAGNLVSAAKIYAVSGKQKLVEQFTFLQKSNLEHCDFILTVAAVFIAATRLRNLRLGEALEQKLMDKVYEEFTRWNANSTGAF